MYYIICMQYIAYDMSVTYITYNYIFYFLGTRSRETRHLHKTNKYRSG